MKNFDVKTFPSICADMGDWRYYITTMTFADVAQCIKRPREVPEDAELKEWLQRKLDDKRLTNIANYLLEQPQHFFSAIVVGIFGGEPHWYPVSVSKGPTLGDVELGERARTTMGVLELSGSEEAFPIDGQHRVEAIKKALEQDDRLAGDEQCIIFVAHRTDKAGHERTRRLFSTLNRYARPVSKGEIIALDQDDTFAIVTRRLIEEHRYLRMRKFTVFTTTPNLPQNDERSITTVLALYDLVKILAAPRTPAGNSQRKDLIIGPPQQNKIESIYRQHVSFWEALRKHVYAIRLVTNSRRKAGSFRKENGGHILFRPVGQTAFANAVRIMMDRGKTLDEAVEVLSHVPLELNSHPWRFVLWNPEQGTVIIKNSTLALNLLLYMAGEEPSSKKYNLEERYQKVLGDSNSGLSASRLLSTLV